MKKTGILLVNLGTPLSPHPKDVKNYLIEFLTDGRVIDIPWLKRQFLVRCCIVPRRYEISAKAYEAIWTPEGSPLLFNSMRVMQALQVSLDCSYHVELGMRYQHPSLELALDKLFEQEISKLVVLPLFPQYASATTGSVHEKIMSLLQRRLSIPKVTFIDSFYDHPGLVEAFCSIGKEQTIGSYDHILFSFHGLPERQIKKCDQERSNSAYCLTEEDCCRKSIMQNKNCYKAQCYHTAQAIATRLQLSKDQYSVCFQSRLGSEPWLTPSASEVIMERARIGNKRLLVFSPSFVCDCLETLYEIEIEYRHQFCQAGGEQLTLVKSLNDHPIWIKALKNIIEIK